MYEQELDKKAEKRKRNGLSWETLKQRKEGGEVFGLLGI
jgi:hypothetical protein